MNNPLNTIKSFVRQQGNPKELLLNFVQRNPQNYMINNLINSAKNGNYQEVENFARNMCKEKNINFDKEFQQFKEQFRR